MAKDEINKHTMAPIPIDELISGANVPVNLYVRIGDNKFILIAKAGTKTDKRQLDNYQDKALEYLWCRKDQYGALVTSTLIIAGMIVKKNSFDLQVKSNVLTKVAKTIFRNMDEAGLNIDSYEHAKEIVEATVTLAENHKDLYLLFDSLKDCSDNLLRHSMAVSTVSVLIAKEMGWDSRSTIEKLALGALLHDIGKKALPRALLDKPKSLMTAEEYQLYETHPYKGMQMLMDLGVVPDDVVSIVYEHHENSIGQGYPRRLRNLKIHPLAKIVAIADEFCNLIMPTPSLPGSKSPREAIMAIKVTMGQPYNKECFEALEKIVRNDPKKLAG